MPWTEGETQRPQSILDLLRQRRALAISFHSRAYFVLESRAGASAGSLAAYLPSTDRPSTLVLEGAQGND